MRSPLLFVEVMGVVEGMEVTLLFVEVKSFQRSKSLRVKEPKSDSMAGEFNMVPDIPTDI